jgi:hypothetical protein
MVKKRSEIKGLTNEQIKEKTGKFYSEWFRLIDESKIKTPILIQRFLEERYELKKWDAKYIVNRYQFKRKTKIRIKKRFV